MSIKLYVYAALAVLMAVLGWYLHHLGYKSAKNEDAAVQLAAIQAEQALSAELDKQAAQIASQAQQIADQQSALNAKAAKDAQKAISDAYKANPLPPTCKRPKAAQDALDKLREQVNGEIK